MDIIKQIHKNSNLVLSWNFSLPWFPSGIGNNMNLLKLKSKISPKLYLWVNKLAKKEIVFNDVYFLDNKNNLEKLDFSVVNKEYQKILDFILKFLEDKNLDFGLEFNIYSEVPRGHWLWFSGVLSALTSSILHYLSWEIDKKFLESIEIFKEEKFDLVYDFAYKLEKISKYNNTNWENSFFAFINKKNPILFLREDKNYDFIDLFSSEEFIYPFDYYIVFSGINSDTQKIEYFLQKDKSKINNIQEFYKNIITNNWILEKKIEKFAEKTLNYDVFVSAFNILNIKLLNSFKKLFEESYSSFMINKFIDIINEHKNLMAMVEGKSLFAEQFLINFYKNSSKTENIWITSIYSWKMWGWYLLVTRLWESRKTIEKTLESLKNTYPDSYIEYCSYEDNENIEWIKISQDIDNWFYSDYIKSEAYVLKTKDKKIIVSNLEEALEKDFDLLFDLVKQKVYLKWKKLTSKQIHSQNILVEIVSKTFDNQWVWFSNNILNKSSYSETKSLMGSKVVYPFKNLIKEEFWKDIEFEISWIWWNFKMKLDFWSLRVWIFEKI